MYESKKLLSGKELLTKIYAGLDQTPPCYFTVAHYEKKAIIKYVQDLLIMDNSELLEYLPFNSEVIIARLAINELKPYIQLLMSKYPEIVKKRAKAIPNYPYPLTAQILANVPYMSIERISSFLKIPSSWIHHWLWEYINSDKDPIQAPACFKGQPHGTFSLLHVRTYRNELKTFSNLVYEKHTRKMIYDK